MNYVRRLHATFYFVYRRAGVLSGLLGRVYGREKRVVVDSARDRGDLRDYLSTAGGVVAPYHLTT